ncbi:MAG: hypothetical protein A2X80_14015 [Geobacteraceae bacterium GWB2_52_12]|nr:MAG: hypothetical protein A2X80_14015 [Geobacteraceae bacterium GWB2_52_12]
MKRSNQIGWAQVRGGIFIFLALLFFAGGVLLMGQKTKMFVNKGSMRIIMADAVGLKVGAPVWLAGVDVGLVTDVLFASPKNSNEVSIDIEVDTNAMKKIGADSKIMIKTRGLMGEKYIDILPSKQYSETPPSILHGTPVTTLDDAIQKAGDTFSKLDAIIDNIEKGKGTLGKLNKDDTLYTKLTSLADKSVKAADDVSALQKQILSKDGSIGMLLNDREFYDKGVSLLTKAESSVMEIKEITGKIKDGNGTAGLLLNDKSLYEKMTKTVDDLDALVMDFKEEPRKYLKFTLF